MTGKEKCRLLKGIRKEIAEANGIVYLSTDCREPDGCMGTCPKCEAELRYLNNEIEKMIQTGEQVVMPSTYFKLATENDSLEFGMKTPTKINPEEGIMGLFIQDYIPGDMPDDSPDGWIDAIDIDGW